MLESLPKFKEVLTSSKNSKILDLSDGETSAVQYTVRVNSIDGTSASVKVIPQFSYDGKQWFDTEEVSHSEEVLQSDSFPYVETKFVDQVGTFFRFHFEVAGTSPEVDIELWAIGRKESFVGGAESATPTEEVNQSSDIIEKEETIDAAGTTYSLTMDFKKVAANNLETTLEVTELTGSDTILEVIPQYSYNDTDWFDYPSDVHFDTVNIDTALPFSQSLDIDFVPPYARFKHVVSGATPHVVFKTYSLAKR